MTGPEWDSKGHARDMVAFDEFEQRVREALTHLYDPAYRPSELLCSVVGCDPQQGLEALQAALIRAIEDLRPGSHVPPTARSRRVYGVLSLNYVQDLSQDETAERLGITPRHLRRELPEAVHVLALRLWRDRTTGPQAEAAQPPDAVPAESKSSEWRSQVRQELASLQEIAPGSMTDVRQAITSAVELGSALTAKRDIHLQAEPTPPDLLAAVHPSVLRQVLITAIGQVVHCMAGGQITLRAERADRGIQVAISGSPAAATNPPNGNLLQEILAAQGGSVRIEADGERLSFLVGLPPVGHVVLVVDDNPDMLHLYQRYVLGTRYHIVHSPEGQRVLDIVEATAPDLILLDVMLPDMDGWELLAQLHELPATRSIPVVVCSVIREEDLALALGATLFVPKPVQRQELIQALDQALSRAAAGGPTLAANSAAAC